MRSAKQLGLACLVLTLVQQAGAFSLLGPVGGGGDAYQTTELSYDLPGDIGAPKNLGEEYRLTAPILYWAVDSSFLDYFGSNGLWAVEQAYTVLNQLTNVSSYSADLSEFPLDSQRVNYLAQSLQLYDLKSSILSTTLEHMGLDSPDRWTWALRDRIPIPGTTCGFTYYVINRNFDPITWAPTRYVNGARYSYIIDEFCPVVDQADAVEILVDPLTLPYTAVASYKPSPYYAYENGFLTYQSGGLVPGSFYLSLTRDDVAGLRYLYRASNVNYENVPTDALQYQTNFNPQLIYGSNLTLLAAQALTNTAAQLQALYPGLTVVNTTNYFKLGYATNYTAYFTNSPYDPALGLPRLVIVTNITPIANTYYVHTFGNLAVVEYTTNGYEAMEVSMLSGLTNRIFQTLQTVAVTNSPYSPVGPLTNTGISFVTNVTRRTYLTNAVAGEFFILPTNACALSIVGTLFTNLTITTNLLVNATNNPIFTNTIGGTNVFAYESMVLEYFTNHAFVILPVQCVTNQAELRQGLERIRFVRSDYDSLLGRFFTPITNDYSMTAVVSNSAVVQSFRRVITAPDIQIQAADLSTAYGARSINFLSNAPLAGLAGPGSIEPAFTITLNKVGPLRVNSTFFSDEATTIFTNFVWASFDSSTNDPIVYPNGNSIRAMENQILIQVAPMDINLPEGTAHEDYTQDFTVAGGQPPYTWSLVSGNANGLTLTSEATNSAAATLSGVPVTPGVYQFTIRVTDAALRYVDRPYSLKINP